MYDLEKEEMSDNEITQKQCALKAGKIFNTCCSHITRSQKALKIEASFSAIDHNNEKAVLAVLKDVTESLDHKQKILDQNDCLLDIAWKQSHLVRSPLANLKSLIIFVKEDPLNTTLLEYMESELNRLDNVIKEMVAETSGFTIANP